jgi:hypothetical protein
MILIKGSSKSYAKDLLSLKELINLTPSFSNKMDLN